MKTIFTIILICALTLMNGCMGPNGPDGQDGNAYIAIYDNDGYTYSYDDNNSNTPFSGYYGHNYETTDGLFSFEYESRIYYPTYYLFAIWTGYYEIWIHNGEKGGEGKIFWQEGDPGKDGEDSYLKLYLDFDGPFTDSINKELLPKNPNDRSDIYYNGNYAIKITYSKISFGKHDLTHLTQKSIFKVII